LSQLDEGSEEGRGYKRSYRSHRRSYRSHKRSYRSHRRRSYRS
jgi:hypothetical protein